MTVLVSVRQIHAFSLTQIVAIVTFTETILIGQLRDGSSVDAYSFLPYENAQHSQRGRQMMKDAESESLTVSLVIQEFSGCGSEKD